MVTHRPFQQKEKEGKSIPQIPRINFSSNLRPNPLLLSTRNQCMCLSRSSSVSSHASYTLQSSPSTSRRPSVAWELEVVRAPAPALCAADKIADPNRKHSEIGLCGRHRARHHFLQIYTQIDSSTASTMGHFRQSQSNPLTNVIVGATNKHITTPPHLTPNVMSCTTYEQHTWNRFVNSHSSSSPWPFVITFRPVTNCNSSSFCFTIFMFFFLYSVRLS